MASIIAQILQRDSNYVYPLAVNLAAAVLPVWAMLRVAGARKRTQLKYPAEYHLDALDETKEPDREKYLFNCTQRAHQNLLEQLPSFLITFNIFAFEFPRVASALGAGWILGRIWYHAGYQKYGPQGRRAGGRYSGTISAALLVGAIYGVVTEYLAL